MFPLLLPLFLSLSSSKEALLPPLQCVADVVLAAHHPTQRSPCLSLVDVTMDVCHSAESERHRTQNRHRRCFLSTVCSNPVTSFRETMSLLPFPLTPPPCASIERGGGPGAIPCHLLPVSPIMFPGCESTEGGVEGCHWSQQGVLVQGRGGRGMCVFLPLSILPHAGKAYVYEKLFLIF